MDTVDLFAGPGGWDVAARAIGTEPMGLEWDASACLTREAAGHATRQDDVAAVDPMDYAGATGVIASPPCQAFSAAGKRRGSADVETCQHVALALAGGQDLREWARDHLNDARSGLVVEPLRWVLALRPEWTCWEQVPPVLPFWEFCAPLLRAVGYHVWTGCLNAEQFGVPQTRRRAFLIASRVGAVAPPVPTHSRFYPRDRGRLDDGVEKWVSMAEALGWGMTERPYPTIACSSTTGGPDMEKVGGSAARKRIYDEQARGAWLVNGNQDNATVRSVDEPASTIAVGNNAARVQWAFERPATTVAGDPRIQPPGHKINAQDIAAGRTHYDGRAGKNAVRVSIIEAAVLQSFTADYPWRGNKSQQFRQVGNAVPPVLARAVLGAAVA